MLNKLHVNIEKSSLMYFTKTSSNHDENYNENDNIPPIMIGPTDETLSCQATYKKKLASCTGSINRIAASIPKNYIF